MNTEKLIQKMELSNKWHSYENEILRPFIDAYYRSDEFNQFDLFSSYVFNYDYVINCLVPEHLKDWYSKETDQKKIAAIKKRYIRGWSELFIGLVKNNNDKYCPLFLHVRKFDNEYVITGFHMWIGDEKYGEVNYKKNRKAFK